MGSFSKKSQGGVKGGARARPSQATLVRYMTPQAASQQRQYADPPNYPAVTQRQFATQITYTEIDHTTAWPVGHNSEEAARRYAENLSARARGEVVVYGLMREVLATFRDGVIRLEVPGSKSGKASQSPIG